MIKFYRSSNLIAQLEPFPSYGFQTVDGSWRVQVSGWAYFPYVPTVRKRWVIRMLAGVMQASENDLQSEIFKERVAKFVSDGSSGHEIYCRVDTLRRKLNQKNKRNGHFSDWVWMNEELVAQNSFVDENGRRTLRFQVETDHSDMKPVESHAYLLPQTGLSVISDIDDTIKISNVGDRRKLLANTFLHEFRGVEGMADLYDQWFQMGTDFHYVSSSPWQLHAPLMELQTHQGFPDGTIHLRNFRLRQHMVERALLIRRHGKSTSIKSLFQTMPNRKFVLIGDSGEKDPEIYRKICRKYVNQVAALFIRDIDHRPMDQDRLEKCRATLPGVICEKFKTAKQLQEIAAPVFEKASSQNGATSLTR